ncbi:hypothetical protein RFI_08444 [Reticulomyxa filosa]|uniref:Uncharacterized protein n=1 Tax=Reticulomyxa filosa TaxID=46433 RepID=X6NSF6_RETFI|nr:hypothetical protein RFI_08444 [Reticulomyxa filosa]|eukprot:ETO28684.1 hypothetical protein RFI_08444 [Reticulomyxa filosa]
MLLPTNVDIIVIEFPSNGCQSIFRQQNNQNDKSQYLTLKKKENIKKCLKKFVKFHHEKNTIVNFFKKFYQINERLKFLKKL